MSRCDRKSQNTIWLTIFLIDVNYLLDLCLNHVTIVKFWNFWWNFCKNSKNWLLDKFGDFENFAEIRKIDGWPSLGNLKIFDKISLKLIFWTKIQIFENFENTWKIYFLEKKFQTNHFGRMNFEGGLIKFWLIPSLQFTFLFYVFGRNNDSKIHKIQKKPSGCPKSEPRIPHCFHYCVHVYSRSVSTQVLGGFS